MKWKRIIGWTALAILALLIVVAVGGYFYLGSGSFQTYAIHQISEKAYTATGARTTVGRLKLDLWHLTAHLYDITLHGAEATVQPPLLHVQELTVRVKVLSILHPKIALQEILIKRPVAHIEVSRNGKNNLPTPPPSQRSSHTNVFDLGVEHAELTNGEVEYNDRKTPVEAELYDLATDIHSESPSQRYSGEISYRSGQLHYADYEPLAHSLDLKFVATPSELTVNPMTLRIADSSIVVQARVSDYSDPKADGEYRILIHTQDFDQMATAVRPAGDISIAGKLHYAKADNQPAIRAIAIDGEVVSGALSALASGRKVDLGNVKAAFQLKGGNLKVHDAVVNALGGRIIASAEMKHLDQTPESQVHANAEGISLRDLQSLLGKQQIPGARLNGTLRGDAKAAWTGSISNLRATSNVFVRAVAASRSNPSAQEVPVQGTIHATIDAPHQTIELRDTSIRLPSATLTAGGAVSQHSNLQLKVVANDLHQLAVLVASFQSAQTQMPAVSGSATATASVHGSLKRPNVSAQVTAQNLAVEGSRWKSVDLQAQASPTQIVVSNASLVNADQGQATLTANVGLHNWSFQNVSPIQAHLQVRRLKLSDIEALLKKQLPITGDLSARLNFSGTQLQPSGTGSAEIANAKAYGEALQAVQAKFHTENQTLVSTLHLAAAAGTLDTNLSYTPSTQTYSVQLNAPAIVLQKLQRVQEDNLRMTGVLSASVKGAGTLKDPQLLASVSLPELKVKQQVISALNAQVQIAHHVATLNLTTNVVQASIQAHGTVRLTGDYQAEATINTGLIPLDPLLVAYASSVPEGFQGQTEFHASLKGPLENKSKLQAHLSIPVLKAAYRQIEIGIARPIQVDYANSVLTLQPAEIRGTDTTLRAEGRIPINGKGTPTLVANGSIDARIAQIFSPTVRSGGKIGIDVHSSGSSITGALQFQNVAVATSSAPVGVDRLNGTVNISKDRVQLSDVTARVGGGSVSLGGSVRYKPKLQFDLAMQGKQMRLLYPQGLRSLLDANIAFSGDTQASVLSGRVLIDSLSFTPDFDLSTFAGQFGGGNALSQPGFADTVKMAVSVQSQQSLNAVSSQISIAGQVALQVGGTAAKPVITGRTTLTSGELFYRNVRYELQRGVITFNNPNETSPVLNVSVATTVEQYNLTLTLRGPLNKLTTSYVSDPPLATADIINLIARGQTTEEQAASSQSTDSMIASQVAGELSSSVQKLAGISSLQIDPTLGGNQNPSARIAVQQRVTKNLLFSFSTDVTQPGSEIVQGDYQINKRWSVSVQRDQLGGISVDGRYHTKF